MPLHPKVNRQNHGDDGGGAEHQNRKQNLHHHRDSGYQNGTAQYPFSRAFQDTITGMKNVSVSVNMACDDHWHMFADDHNPPSSQEALQPNHLNGKSIDPPLKWFDKDSVLMTKFSVGFAPQRNSE